MQAFHFLRILPHKLIKCFKCLVSAPKSFQFYRAFIHHRTAAAAGAYMGGSESED